MSTQKINSCDSHPPRNILCRNIRNYFREYCKCTSIHGFRYFGEKRTIFERVWWFIIFVICLAACTISIYEVYKKWERSPVIVSFATRGTPIYSIPFPSVTVCPESKSISSKFNFTDLMTKKRKRSPLSAKKQKYFEYMTLLCTYYQFLPYMNNRTFPEEFFDVINEVKPSFMIWNCYYMGKSVKCGDLFVPIITDEGICYTFNTLDRTEIFRDTVVHYSNYHQVPEKSSNWSIEYGYQENAGLHAYPRRALLAGAKNALRFTLVTKKEVIDYACKNSIQGYRVVLHTAMRLPRPSQEYFRIPLNQDVMGAIQPVMITTSDSVKIYNPRRRECYFPSERHLKYFKIYSQLNCMMECLTNHTLDSCGCVNFFMPRENGTEICGTGRIKCMMNAELEIQMKDLRYKLEIHKNHDNAKTKNEDKPKKPEVKCDCMPICSDLTYDVETSQTDFDWVEQYKALQLIRGNVSRRVRHISSLAIFFRSNHFITSQRNELYGPTDFLANFGGLLGLFTGFSILSFMEILYFLSVRLICNIRLYGYWAGLDS